MITNQDITVIIPVHIWDDSVKTYFNEAIKTIPSDTNVIISTPNGSNVEISNDVANQFASFAMVFNNESSSFQALVNTGVKNVKTGWFSILEFDDEYSPIWFKNFIKYQEYNQQYNFFLPINDLYKTEEGKNDEFVGNGNEAVWASSFSEEIGVIDEKSLDDYFDFYLTGGIFNTKAWNEVGGLKESMKLTFWYEFMLRAAHKGEKFYVVPKIGYSHLLGRNGSLLMQYRENIDTKESDFWFKTARKEAYFTEDREKVYDPNSKPNNDDNESSED